MNVAVYADGELEDSFIHFIPSSGWYQWHRLFPVCVQDGNPIIGYGILEVPTTSQGWEVVTRVNM